MRERVAFTVFSVLIFSLKLYSMGSGERELTYPSRWYVEGKSDHGAGETPVTTVRLVLDPFPHSYFLVYSDALAAYLRREGMSTVPVRFLVTAKGHRIQGVGEFTVGKEVAFSSGHGCGKEQHLAPCDASGQYKVRDPFAEDLKR